MNFRRDIYSILTFLYISEKMGIPYETPSLEEDYESFDMVLSGIPCELKADKKNEFKKNGEWDSWWTERSCRCRCWQGNEAAISSNKPLQMLKPLKYQTIIENNGRLIMIARDGVLSITASELQKAKVCEAKWEGKVFQEGKNNEKKWQERIIFDMNFGKYTPFSKLLSEEEYAKILKTFEEQEGKENNENEVREFAKNLGFEIV